ncbi:MAG: hypothetical protein AAGK17_05370 [Pseudomonadota bacterium]
MRAFTALLVYLAAWLGICVPAFAQTASQGPITMAELEAKARDACGGAIEMEAGAIRRADMDGDGKSDVLFEWRYVTCDTSSALMQRGAGYCGMHNCGIDIYLSSTYRPGSWPKTVMNHTEIPASIVGNRLRTATQGGSCKFAQVCRWEWSWDGNELVSRPLSDAAQVAPASVSTSLPITVANLAGDWVDGPDGCSTDTGMALKPNGDFASYEQNGDWRLLGKRIAIVVRETYVMGDGGSTQTVANPKAKLLTVETLTKDQLSLIDSEGNRTNFRRCS